VRRLLVLGVAFALVFGIGRVLGGERDDSSEPSARPASSGSSGPATPSALSTADARAGEQPRPQRKKTKTPLPMPTGPCQDSDVRVVPSLEEDARAGGDVRLTLRLATFESPACNWQVSAESVVVKLTSGSDRIWTSQECPRAVPREAVVLRKRPATTVDVSWSGRRSDSDCSRTTLWAEPGYYHVSAAAMGSEPESQQFRLMPPAPVTITPTPTPRPKPPGADRQRQRGGNGGGNG
jgi:hypothetical protein